MYVWMSVCLSLHFKQWAWNTFLSYLFVCLFVSFFGATIRSCDSGDDRDICIIAMLRLCIVIIPYDVWHRTEFLIPLLLIFFSQISLHRSLFSFNFSIFFKIISFLLYVELYIACNVRSYSREKEREKKSVELKILFAIK